MERIDFLFIPVSGSAGTGESSKALQFIEAIAEVAPQRVSRLLLAGQSPLLAAAGELAVALPGAPTRHTAEVVAALERLRPRVVVFDSTSRVAQLQAARRLGAKVVYIGPRPSAIRRGFGLRRMRLYDEYWIGTPAVLGGRLGWWQRLLLRWHKRVQLRRFDAFYLDPGPPPAQAHGPVLFSPGGRDYDGLFGAAAGAVARATGIPCTVVLARPELAPSVPGLTVLPRINNRELLRLVQGARHVVSNGGDFLVQLLCLGHSPVCTALASDQGPRIRLLARDKLVVPVPAELQALVGATCADLAAPQQLAQRRQRIRALGLQNGMGGAVQALLELAEASSSKA